MTTQANCRDSLPKDADNYEVFCERCQKVHRYYTFTQEDFDRGIKDGAKNLSDAIDAKILDYVLPAKLCAAGRPPMSHKGAL